MLWLEEHEHLAPHEVATAPWRNAPGLLALARAADMRAIEAAADHDEPDAVLALDVYIHRLAAGIAAMTAAFGGLDTLVFSGGDGENSPLVRFNHVHRRAPKAEDNVLRSANPQDLLRDRTMRQCGWCGTFGTGRRGRRPQDCSVGDAPHGKMTVADLV